MWVDSFNLDGLGRLDGRSGPSRVLSRLGYMNKFTENCQMVFDVAAQREAGSNAEWPIPEDPETAFARTIFADGSGLAFYAVFGGAEDDRDHLRSHQSTPSNTYRRLALWRK